MASGREHLLPTGWCDRVDGEIKSVSLGQKKQAEWTKCTALIGSVWELVESQNALRIVIDSSSTAFLHKAATPPPKKPDGKSKNLKLASHSSIHSDVQTPEGGCCHAR